VRWLNGLGGKKQQSMGSQKGKFGRQKANGAPKGKWGAIKAYGAPKRHMSNGVSLWERQCTQDKAMKPIESGNEPVALSQMKGNELVAMKPIERQWTHGIKANWKWQWTHGIEANWKWQWTRGIKPNERQWTRGIEANWNGNEPVALKPIESGNEPIALKPIESGNEPVALSQMNGNEPVALNQ
jgi:hypothetical protein